MKNSNKEVVAPSQFRFGLGCWIASGISRFPIGFVLVGEIFVRRIIVFGGAGISRAPQALKLIMMPP